MQKNRRKAGFFMEEAAFYRKRLLFGGVHHVLDGCLEICIRSG